MATETVKLDLARLVFWESTLLYAHTTGPYPYPDPNYGYNPNQSEHYDPIEVYQLVEAYCTEHGIDPSDYSDQLAAAILRYRDEYVLRDAAGGQVPGHVTYTTGMAHHWQQTGDPKDVQAIDQLRPYDNGYIPAADYATYFIDRNQNPYAHREAGYRVKSYLDRRRVGLEKHQYQDIDADIVMECYDHLALPKTERYGAGASPFMLGMTMRALIDYMDFFHLEAVPDAEEQARLDVIPGKIQKALDWIWDHGWWPAGYPAVLEDHTTIWDKGSLKYYWPRTDQPDMQPLEGFTIEAVIGTDSINRKIFTATGPLSEVDDFYKFLCPSKCDKPKHPEMYVASYKAATREFVVGGLDFAPSAGQPFTLQVERDSGLDYASPLNLLCAHAYAWMYWFQKVRLGDEPTGLIYRSRYNAMFNGAVTAWQMPYLHKEYNQSVIHTPAGLKYREYGDGGIDYWNPPVPTLPGTGKPVMMYTLDDGSILLVPRGVVASWSRSS